MDSPKESVLGNLGMPDQQLVPSAPAIATLYPPSRLEGQILGFLERHSHLSQADSLAASTFSLGPLSPSNFPRPPSGTVGRDLPAGSQDDPRGSAATSGNRISQNESFYLPPSAPFATTTNNTGFAITSFIEGESRFGGSYRLG